MSLFRSRVCVRACVRACVQEEMGIDNASDFFTLSAREELVAQFWRDGVENAEDFF